MTYVSKKAWFAYPQCLEKKDRGYMYYVRRKRSDHQLKKMTSCEDSRAWSDDAELQYQHLLNLMSCGEFLTKPRFGVIGRFIPFPKIISFLKGFGACGCGKEEDLRLIRSLRILCEAFGLLENIQVLVNSDIIVKKFDTPSPSPCVEVEKKPKITSTSRTQLSKGGSPANSYRKTTKTKSMKEVCLENPCQCPYQNKELTNEITKQQSRLEEIQRERKTLIKEIKSYSKPTSALSTGVEHETVKKLYKQLKRLNEEKRKVLNDTIKSMENLKCVKHGTDLAKMDIFGEFSERDFSSSDSLSDMKTNEDLEYLSSPPQSPKSPTEKTPRQSSEYARYKALNQSTVKTLGYLEQDISKEVSSGKQPKYTPLIDVGLHMKNANCFSRKSKSENAINEALLNYEKKLKGLYNLEEQVQDLKKKTYHYQKQWQKSAGDESRIQAACSKSLKNMEFNLEAMQRERDELKIDKVQICAENQRLKDEIERLNNENKAQQRKMQNQLCLEMENQSLTERLSDLAKMIEKKERGLQSERDKSSRLENTIALQRDEITRLTERVKRLIRLTNCVTDTSSQSSVGKDIQRSRSFDPKPSKRSEDCRKSSRVSFTIPKFSDTPSITSMPQEYKPYPKSSKTSGRISSYSATRCR